MQNSICNNSAIPVNLQAANDNPQKPALYKHHETQTARVDQLSQSKTVMEKIADMQTGISQLAASKNSSVKSSLKAGPQLQRKLGESRHQHREF